MCYVDTQKQERYKFLPSWSFQSMKKGNMQRLKYRTQFGSAVYKHFYTDRLAERGFLEERARTVPRGKTEDFWEDLAQ